MQDQNQPAGAKQQIVERLKSSNNILVTVSSNPNVDELSAALSLALLLNKMDKHATSVFSGAIPPAIEFLQPEKTFEGTVDSLRDFIIALDKDKADRLRYKVENDVVRIFITPYRTKINENDLVFSQGDFNVDSIVALGVTRRNDLDTAITAHGRILHDATVITVNAGNESSDLGSLDWHDQNASSLCEMLMSMSEALQPGLLDQQIATALLTGIVSATERFSNQHTTPRVMTMAAQLMAAGANQQLIASKLEIAGSLRRNDDNTKSSQDKSAKAEKEDTANRDAVVENNGELHVLHHNNDQKEPVKDEVPPEPALPKPDYGDPDTYGGGSYGPTEKQFETEMPIPPAPPAAGDNATMQELADELEKEAARLPEPILESESVAKPELVAKPEPQKNESLPKIKKQKKRSWITESLPTSGGVLNATAEEAMESRIKAEAADKQRPILHHDTLPAPTNQDNEPSSAELSSQETFNDNVADLPAAEVVQESEPFAQSAEEPASAPPPLTETLNDNLAPENELTNTNDNPPSNDAIQPLPPLTPPQDVPPPDPVLEFPALDFEEAPLPQPQPRVEPTPINVKSPEPQPDKLTLSEIETKAKDLANGSTTKLDQADIDRAREAVNSVLQNATFEPANQPHADLNALPLGDPITHEHATADTSANQPPAEAVVLPPLPDYSTLPQPPPLPDAQYQDVQAPPTPPAAVPVGNLNQPLQSPASPSPAPQAPSPAATEPGQFRIPGQ